MAPVHTIETPHSRFGTIDELGETLRRRRLLYRITCTPVPDDAPGEFASAIARFVG